MDAINQWSNRAIEQCQYMSKSQPIHHIMNQSSNVTTQQTEHDHDHDHATGPGKMDTLQTYREEFHSQQINPTRRRNHGITSKPNRPPESRWVQQKLPAWQPMIHATNIVITFYLFSLILLSLGGFMLHTMLKVHEYSLDYTDCKSVLDDQIKCSDRWKLKLSSCKCAIEFRLKHKLQGPVFIYYGLDGFFQNHRRYVTSLDRYQLLGQDRSLEDIRSNCYPFSDVNGKIIAPCGVIADSMFTDKFEMILVDTNTTSNNAIQIKQKEISWPFDRDNLFKNPVDMNQFKRYHKPLNWSIRADQLDPDDPENNAYQNEHFMIWMRTAAFSTFRKLWGRIDVESLPYSLASDRQALPAGQYRLIVHYDYRTVFEKLRIGKKVIISNMSWMGGKNYFLPIAYMVTGMFCSITATVFIFLPRKKFESNHTKPAGGNVNRAPPLAPVYQSTSQTSQVTNFGNDPTASTSMPHHTRS